MIYSTVKTNILAVAPYPGLHKMIEQIGKTRNDISLTVLEGDYEEGLQAVQKELLNKEYDLLISRGGTAEILRKNIPLPVFEIEITASDILYAIKLADAYRGKSALVGFRATTKYAKTICKLLENDMPIYTIWNAAEADAILKQLHDRGYSLVICDTIVSIKAVDAGLTPVLITSSQESIEKVFELVTIFGNTFSRNKTEKTMLTALLKNSNSDLAAFTMDGRILYSTPMSDEASAFLQEIIINKTYEGTGRQTFEYTKQFGNKYLTLTITASEDYEDVFYGSIRHTRPPCVSRTDFIKVFSNNFEIAQDFFFQSKIVETYFQQYPQEDILFTRTFPVIILGETGTFYDSVVSHLYEQNTEFRTSLTIINLKDCKSQNLNWLINHVNSPLFNDHTSLYFKNIASLSPELRRDLLSFLEQGGICKQNKVYFSIDIRDGALAKEDNTAICRMIRDALSAKVLEIAPLRECPDIIPNLTVICINQLNMKYNKQIAGIAPDGIKELQYYVWPDNFEQFYRFIKTLTQTTGEVLIPPEEIKKAINSEKAIYNSTHSIRREIPFDLHRPLDNIMQDVVRQVVANENGNRKRAAEILEVSRTTVWRMLKEST